MTDKKSVKRALLLSVLATFMCVAMLIGTTFAWFTDTASTAVNKIKSGNLDIALEMKENGEWVDAEGRTLSFLKKQEDGSLAEDANILWEPGCTYELPELRVVNNGNLALKYKLQITGINGDAKLNEVIDWTASLDGTDYTVDAEHHLAAKTSSTVDFDVLTVKGHMDETADNDYMNLSIDGIGITVIATQDAVEYDSFGNTYDTNAKYPANVYEIKKTYGTDGISMPAGVVITDNEAGWTGNNGKFTITLNDEEAFVYFTQVFDRAAAFEARKTGLENGTITRYTSEYTLPSLNMWYGPYVNAITVKMGCDVDLHGMEVKPFGLSGYVFNFDGNGHTIKNAKVSATSGDAGFFMSRANVSNVVLDNIQVTATGCGSAGIVAGAPNSFIDKVTVKNCSVIGGKYTGAIAGYDYGDITNCVVESTTVSGQYKVGGIVGYVCADSAEQQRVISANKLTNVTVKGENPWTGKTADDFVIGKIVGNWNAANGTCKDNTFSGTTDATANIGKIESDCTVQQ